MLSALPYPFLHSKERLDVAMFFPRALTAACLIVAAFVLAAAFEPRLDNHSQVIAIVDVNVVEIELKFAK
jgi:hypothetical protein